MLLRTLRREEPERRRPPRRCSEPSCNQATREGKPFCSDHVELHPYVQRLLAELREREEADERVRRKGPRMVEPTSLTSQEILTFIHVHGPKTVKRLARELNADLETLKIYAQGLKRLGLVKLTATRRKSTLVHPIPEAWAELRRKLAPPTEEAERPGEERRAA
jgi:hypothetical protein